MVREGHGEKLSYYDFEFTPFFAAQVDPRFCYCLFVPFDYEEDSNKTYDLIVLVHGTERSPMMYRQAFAEFANANDAIILAPLFPCNSFGGYDLDNYKFIECNGVRYDHILLSMIDEVEDKYRLKNDGFLMFGFSGGGHFTHRFFYLHPERMKAASIGAPGMVTLLDDRFDFWAGTRDFEAKFGKPFNYNAMRKVRVQMVIGAEDTELWEIGMDETSDGWMPGAEITGPFNRRKKMEELKKSFEVHGITVQHDIVPGAAHSTKLMVPAVIHFFHTVLNPEGAKGAAKDNTFISRLDW